MTVGPESFVSGLVANMKEAVVSVDRNQNIVLFNRAAEEMFGYAASEVLGRHLDLLLPEAARDAHRRHVTEFGVGTQESRNIGAGPGIRGRRKDGVLFPADISIFRSAGEGEAFLTAVLRDPSPQRADQAAPRDSKIRFEALLEQMAVGVVLSAPDGRWLRVNEKLCDMLGYGAQELMDLGFRSITHPEDVDSDVELLGRLKAGEIPFFIEEKRLVRKDGSDVWVFVTVSLVRDDRGEPDFFVTILENIWRRARIREELRRSEERFHDIASSIPGVVYQFRLDAQGRPSFPFVSPTLYEITGLQPEQVMADANLWIDTIHPDDRTSFEASVERSARSLEPWTWEGRMYRASGDLWWIRGASVPRAMEDGGILWNGLVLDVTESKQAEELLQQAQKMEAVGQLTGGVAHDFNNLLSVIMGNAELLQDQLGNEAKPVNAILRAAFRGAELTQRLLAFSRQQPLRPQPIDLEAMVSGMSNMLARTLGETIEMRTSVAPNLWNALADQGQVENALLNLALNARDAMPDGGNLTVECQNAHLDEAYAAQNLEAVAGDYVLLSVSDNGTGIPAKALKQVFEPFFTTKDVGQGSGLGLSMVYGFAKQSAGHVSIYSEEGQGTTVNLYLPRATEPCTPVKPRREQEVPRGRGEAILVIEDDPDVRHLAVRMLENLGYRVSEVANGAAAHKFLAEGGQVDLVLSDVVLPGGTSGPEFAKEACAIYPDLKVVFMSGYPAEAAKRNGFLGSDRVLINKPFRTREVAKALRGFLD
jgi:PAS domain S-box-containing protein